MVNLLAGIDFLLYLEVTLPAVAGALIKIAFGRFRSMLSSIPGCCPAFRDCRKSGQLQTGFSGQLRPEWVDNFEWIGWSTSNGARIPPYMGGNSSSDGFAFGHFYPRRIIDSTSIMIILALGILVFVYFRFGLLAMATVAIVMMFLVMLPITTHPEVFYFEMGLTGLVLLLAFALYAFYTSLGGRPIFGTPRLDD